jgi:mannose-6-phosphate isomerase-like protein (cupin superfamily)
MAYSGGRELILANRHTGERVAMRRVKRGDDVWLELKGSLPPHQQGPPLHIHVAEDEEGVVRSGTLSAVLNGRRFTAGSGEWVSLPRGSTHRWWNDGNEPLMFEGYSRPAVDLDRLLQGIFEVLNAGSPGRPPTGPGVRLAVWVRRSLPKKKHRASFELGAEGGTRSVSLKP